MKARLDEIFETVKKQIILPGFNLNAGISFLLTGGGSNLFNIDKYCKNYFGPIARIEQENDKQNEKNLEKNFAACLGALKIIKDGWETEAIPEKINKNIKKIGFLAKIFGT